MDMWERFSTNFEFTDRKVDSRIFMVKVGPTDWLLEKKSWTREVTGPDAQLSAA